MDFGGRPSEHDRDGVVFDDSVPVTVQTDKTCRTSEGSAGRRVVPRGGPKAILEAQERNLDAFLLRDKVPHPSARDELLPLDYATEEHADDHDYDRDLDQRESALLTHHSNSQTIRSTRVHA